MSDEDTLVLSRNVDCHSVKRQLKVSIVHCAFIGTTAKAAKKMFK